MIQNRSGQPSHQSPPFNRWKMSTVKRLGDLSSYNFSKCACFGWLGIIVYRFEFQLQREDVNKKYLSTKARISRFKSRLLHSLAVQFQARYLTSHCLWG